MGRIMGWIDELPGVGKTDLPAQRGKVEAKMAEAKELQEKAKKLEEEAYFSSLRIEAEAKKLYSIDQVSQAKELA